MFCALLNGINSLESCAVFHLQQASNMRRVVALQFSTLVFILSYGQCYSQDCPLLTSGSSVFSFPVDPATANEANARCQFLGGKLARVDTSNVEQVKTIIKQTYTQGLTKVWAFQNRLNDADRFRYSLSPVATSGWQNTTLNNRHFSFFLYESLSPLHNVIVRFCRDGQSKKWLINIDRNCTNAWLEDFTLYASQGPSTDTTELHRFTRMKTFSSKVSPNISIPTGFLQRPKTLNVPVVNVRAGSFPPITTTTSGSSSTPCSPAIYRLQWGEWSNDCEIELNATTNFICQNTLSTKFEQRCSSVDITWSQAFKSLPVSRDGNDVSVAVVFNENGTETIKREIPYKSNFVNMPLQPGNTVNVQVTATFKSCSDHVVTINSSFLSQNLAKYKIMERSLTLKNRLCAITLPSIYSNTPFCSIQVVSTSKSGTQTDDVILNQNGRFIFEVKKHSLNYDVSFTVFATSLNRYEGVTANLTCSESIKASRDASMISLIVAVVVVFILLVVIISIAIFYYKRRYQKNQLPTLSVYRPNAHPDSVNSPFRANGTNEVVVNVIEIPPANISVRRSTRTSYRSTNFIPTVEETTCIPADNLLRYYMEHSVHKQESFRKMYDEICKKCKENETSNSVAKMECNKAKNRYQDIYPYNCSRVVLNGDEYNNYINASYIEGHCAARKFIATQGPKPQTVDDFWRMIWENGSDVIVMLTKLFELGKGKCAKYWPDNGKCLESGELDVETIEEVQLGGLIRRKFILSNHQIKRHVTHFQYTSWPDHGIPVTSSNLVYLVNEVKAICDDNPIVVHCSAGVGRTGTFIAADVLFDQLNASGRVDVVACMTKMRKARSNMIQSAEQFIYIHRLLAEYNWSPESDRTVDEFRIFGTDQGLTIIQDEFDRLEALKPIHVTSEFEECELDEDSNRVSVVMPSSNEEIQVGALYIKDASFPRTYVAARSEGFDDQRFWLMVVECNVLQIIELEDAGSTITLMRNNESVTYGDVTLNILDVEEKGGFLQQRIKVSLASRTFDPIEVVRLCGFDWLQDLTLPLIPLVGAINTIHHLECSVTRSKLLVQCRNGFSRTGMFIASMNAIDRFKSLQRIDMFRNLLDLRSIDSNLVDTFEMYNYCYDLLSAYMSTYNSTYANLRG